MEILQKGLEWRDIPGYEDQYIAHPTGQIASVRNQSVLKATPLHLKERIYVTVSLPRIKEKGFRNRYVHRLILETFIGPCPRGHHAEHLDGDSLNNCLTNLRWAPNLSRKFQIVANPDPQNGGHYLPDQGVTAATE
jgi:hypothetical protein